MPREHAQSAQPECDLAGAVHEVSNALTIVLGWLDAARAQLPPGETRDALELARAHAWLGHRIARRAIGAEVPDESPRACGEVAEEVVRGVGWEASRRGVTVFTQVSSGCTWLDSPGSAQQVLLNLLLNAVAFTPAGGRVTLSQRAEPNHVVFVVEDQGPGLEWDPQEGNPRGPPSTRAGGAGIGLAYSMQLARSLGGELRLVNRGPGAVFELKWPRGNEHSGARRADAASASLDRLRVLVLEDDPAVVSLIEVALEARGAEVLAASTLDELMELVERQFDVALVDLSPISGDIMAGLAKMRGAWKGLPIVLITGTAVALPAGAEEQLAAWVRKPFDMSEIIDVLGEVLGR